MLTYYLFPELSKRAKSLLGIEVIPLDLRWGVDGISPDKQVETCLKQIDNSDLFVGLLGERYGWTPRLNPSGPVKALLESKNIQGTIESIFAVKTSKFD